MHVLDLCGRDFLLKGSFENLKTYKELIDIHLNVRIGNVPYIYVTLELIRQGWQQKIDLKWLKGKVKATVRNDANYVYLAMIDHLTIYRNLYFKQT